MPRTRESDQAVGLETENGVAVRPRNGPLSEAALDAISTVLCWEAIGMPLPFSWAVGADALPTMNGEVLHNLYPFTCYSGGFCRQTAARIYVDHYHPEYSCPVALKPHEAVRHAARGQWLMEDAAVRIARNEDSNPSGHRIVVFGNNTSIGGESFGGHVSISYSARVPQKTFVDPLASFYAPLQILTGSGSLVWNKKLGQHEFWVSQRGPYFPNLFGLHTTVDRAIINTRYTTLDVDRSRARLHNIPFDTNMNEIACLLKTGLPMIMMSMVEADDWPRHLQLSDPVEAFRTIAADPTLTVTVHLLDGRWLTALQLLNYHLVEMGRFFQTRPVLPWQQDVLSRFAAVLGLLDTNLFEAHRVLDWVAKLQAMRGWQTRTHYPEDRWEAPTIHAINLQYHSYIRRVRVEGDKVGLYHQMRRKGRVDTLFTDRQIREARPGRTRDAVRLLLLRRYGPSRFRTWSTLALVAEGPTLPSGLNTNWINFRFEKTRLTVPGWLAAAVADSPTIPDLARRLQRELAFHGGRRDNITVSYGSENAAEFDIPARSDEALD